MRYSRPRSSAWKAWFAQRLVLPTFRPSSAFFGRNLKPFDSRRLSSTIRLRAAAALRALRQRARSGRRPPGFVFPKVISSACRTAATTGERRSGPVRSTVARLVPSHMGSGSRAVLPRLRLRGGVAARVSGSLCSGRRRRETGDGHRSRGYVFLPPPGPRRLAAQGAEAPRAHRVHLRSRRPGASAICSRARWASMSPTK